MEKAYKYRIYPNRTQEQLIQKTFGCCRFVYNHFLNMKIETYKSEKKNLSYNNLSERLTKLKKDTEWLREIDSISLQQSLRDLDKAYENFFKFHSGYPKFKSKKNRHKSYRTNNIQFCGKHIKLPKLGFVKIRDKQIPQGRILNATISQVPSGKYYVSLCCTDVEIKKYSPTHKKVGIDLGIKDFAITSDGVKYENPKHLTKSLNKLAKLQRELSRKTRNSSNWNKARIKVARLHEHISNQRNDYLNKLSTELVSKYDTICIEDLSVKDMMKNHKLARSIADVSWYEFTRKLTYKADWYGKSLVKINQFYPSSQTCHCCGYRTAKTKDLSVRRWMCPYCRSVLDRDVNAAINILNEGLKIA